MQPAISVPWRGGFAVAIVAIAASSAFAPETARPIDLRLANAVETVSIKIGSIPSGSRDTIDFDVHWRAANHLANVIGARRYAEIDRAVAAIDPWSSPYAAWVPAAIDLAVEQLDATQNAYARMDMCREMHRFRAGVLRDWPAGAARMQHVYCEVPWVCGTARHEAIKAAGSVEAYRKQQDVERALRELETESSIAKAWLNDDSTAMLEACAQVKTAFPPECVAAACRLQESTLVEVMRERAEPGEVADCGLQPVDLVRVHPDAPMASNERAFVIIDW